MFKTKLKKWIAITSLLAGLIAIPALAQANVWETLGCDDRNESGTVKFNDCIKGGTGDDVVISFTDFEGELAAPDPEGYAAGLTQATDARSYILNVVNFALGFLGLIAVVVVIYGGILYVISGGEPEKAGKGKKVIGFAAIGLLIVMGSFALVNTILRAPSDSETGTIGGPTQGSIRGVADQQRFNYLANEVEQIMRDLVENYRVYYTLKEQFDQSIVNMMSVADNQKSICFAAPLQPCINNVYNAIDSELNIIANYINDSALHSSTQVHLRDMVNEMRALATTQKQEVLSASRSRGCDKDNTFADNNPCGSAEINTILDAPDGFIYGTIIAFQASYLGGATSGTYYKPEGLDQNILAAGYQANIAQYKDALHENVYSIVRRLTAPAEGVRAFTGVAASRFEQLLSDGGLFDDESDNAVNSLTPSGSSLSGSQLISIIETLDEVLQILRSLEFVYVNLTADIVEGNAPLGVNFSTVGSSDPSGLTISSDRIRWDIDGDGEFNEGIIDSEAQYLECEEGESSTASCIFKQPGTYRVTVQINPPDSNAGSFTGDDFSEIIAPGRAYIDIKVNPPATRINITANGEEIIKYDEAGFLVTDRDNLYVTLAEARAGINFSAAETNTQQGKTVLNNPSILVRWNFGVESENNDTSERVASGETLDRTQAYLQKGRYLVSFEVRNQNNVIDRKLFNVVVSDVAPRITNPDRQSPVGKEVIFNGSDSSFDPSTVPNPDDAFKWTITKRPKSQLTSFIQKAFAQSEGVPQLLEFDNATGEAVYPDYTCVKRDNIERIGCTFKEPGNYLVSLAIDTDTIEPFNPVANTTIKINANQPVAGFQSTRVSENFPSVYLLDGENLSFDYDAPNEQDRLEYSWNITTENCVVVGSKDMDQSAIESAAATQQSTQQNCSELREFSASNKAPVIKFTDKGDYDVTLQVRTIADQESMSETVSRTLFVDKVLGVYWLEMTPTAVLQVLDASGQPVNTTAATIAAQADGEALDQLPGNVNPTPVAPVTFSFASPQAVSWELEFGDGQFESGPFPESTRQAEVTHNYTQTGKYNATLRVYDADDVENSISRNIFIGDAETPIAIISANLNTNKIEPADIGEYTDALGKTCSGEENAILVSKKDNVTFSSEDSVNTDGTGRRLRFSWDIDNGAKLGTGQSISERFAQKTICNEPIVVKLTATNERDVTQKGEDSVNIVVVGEPPVIRSLTAVADDGNNFVTPVRVQLEAVGAEDPDGQITQYRWWYYDINSPNEEKGIQITQTPAATITIGTDGDEGDENVYSFGVEALDDDNISYRLDSDTATTILPTVKATNGPNKPPQASFTVDRTSVFAGESVNFTSSSSDPDEDGGIKRYIWDFGDGSKKQTGENLASVSHVYERANVDGYTVRLTVEDNLGSEATAQPIKIFVDAIAGPPTAAFTVKQDGGAKSASLTDNSSADEAAGASIERRTWDCNVNEDSDGDGVKDNDEDSTGSGAKCSYDEYGIYRARLTVEDDLGQTDFVTNFVNIREPAAEPIAGNIDPNEANMAARTLGANIFVASSQVPLGLLLGSIGAYGILLIVARRQKRKTNKSNG